MVENNKEQKKQYGFSIPLGGTLGILAHGYKGVMMWRQVRHDYAQNQVAKEKKENLNEKK